MVFEQLFCKVHPQRHHLFHTISMVKGQYCLLVIDSGSTRNVVSKHFVEKLRLPLQPHPRAYYVKGDSDNSHHDVLFQCKIPFSIGKYRDTILFDVADMNVHQLLLGRPWLFDVDATHRGRANTYTFVKDSREFVLGPPKVLNRCEIEKLKLLWRTHEADLTPRAHTQSPPPPMSED